VAGEADRLRECLDALTGHGVSFLDLVRRDTLLEKIVYLVLEGKGPWEETTPAFSRIVQEIRHYPTNAVKTVVFGGGTGLSSILSSAEAAVRGPSPARLSGLNRLFPELTVAVCMTDDGGSSGRILRCVPAIAVGDIRRAVLASVTSRGLSALYGSMDPSAIEAVVRFLHTAVNHRFSLRARPHAVWNPLLLVPRQERDAIPGELVSYLSNLGRYFAGHPFLGAIPLEGQCLGNLWLIAAMYRCRESDSTRSMRSRSPHPLHRHIIAGIHEFAERIGAGRGRVFPASTTQGELRFLYSHGVVSCGEHKSSLRHSSFPVERVWVDFMRRPHTSPALLQRIREADLIILAPGSLYTSIIPIFQIPQITEAVRSNTRALKIMGANFWAQRGETDISIRRLGKEYYVSELLEAYDANIPGGIDGLVHQIVVTDLQSIPGDILRNYALEGKVPIYLDKKRVLDFGIEAVEAAVFSEERLQAEKVIQHDAEKFSLVIKTLWSLRDLVTRPAAARLPERNRGSEESVSVRQPERRIFLCEYAARAKRRIEAMDIPSRALRTLLEDIVWNNREILLDHLDYFRGIQVVPARSWARSTEWDKILGYYEPEDGYIKIHESLTRGEQRRLVEDILIAMGESLLGNYVLWKRVQPLEDDGEQRGKIFEVYLRRPDRRRCFLGDRELREYLGLAQLGTSSKDENLFYMLINDNEAFTPPGLLFGLLYAWYLNNQLGGVVDYEMSLLKWKISELIPKQSMERTRRSQLIEFFRNHVFRQRIPSGRQ
jgi:uncharacterized cofD-like protein